MTNPSLFADVFAGGSGEGGAAGGTWAGGGSGGAWAATGEGNMATAAASTISSLFIIPIELIDIGLPSWGSGSSRPLARRLPGREHTLVAPAEVVERRVVEDGGSGVADVQKQVEEPRMARLGANAMRELDGVAERGQRAVHHAHDVAEEDLRRRPPQPVATAAAALARDDAPVLERDENRLQELLRDLLRLRDLVDLDQTPILRVCEVDD